MGGPHRHRELELMLAGTKPMARFVAEPNYRPDDRAFDHPVANGALIRTVIVDGAIERRYYCLPGEEWRVRLAEAAIKYDLSLSVEDLHRLDGFLLGYDKRDVDAFVADFQRMEGSR
jgi:hypothetical protein